MSSNARDEPTPEDLEELLLIAEDDDLGDLAPDARDSPVVADAKKRRRTVLLLRKVVIAIGGSLVLAAGIAMIPLPGPGWLVVVAGLYILSLEFAWADRLFNRIKDKVIDAAHMAAANKWGTGLSVLSALSLVAAGIVWAMWDELPLSSWPTGIALSASGVLALGTIWWASTDLKKKRRRSEPDTTSGPAANAES
ncbi:PGPGW domain-containing protein [Sporichthya sp.]|uniref:PGPGW domain-containing protein n=1 Tax=Sporichthya sp. TaxID=65475 RepID=UPI00184D66DB|nr:PGPGW domain-containing protein [Sporichthya sp.]MBA3745027.1 PGPGW domain-containing protein [Sporichthya sp.]